jgi:HEAT repeat protein
VDAPEPPRLGPWARADLVRAGLRALVGAVALGSQFGPTGWPFVGLVLGVAALVEGTAGARPRAGRITEAALLSVTVGLVGLPAALFNGVYLSALTSGGPAAALADVEGAWRALADPRAPDPLAPVMLWSRAWKWVDEPGCLLGTAVVLAVVLGVSCAMRLAARRQAEQKQTKGDGCTGGLAGGMVGLLATCFVMPPGLPPEARSSSGQGLEEVLLLWWFVAVVATTLSMTDLVADLLTGRPAEEQPRPARLRALFACGALWTVTWTLLLPAPLRARGPHPHEALVAALAAPGPGRAAALATIGSDVLALQSTWPHVLTALDDPDPAVRRLAAEVLRRTPAAQEDVVRALVRRAVEDPVPGVRAAAAETAGYLCGWGASGDLRPLASVATTDSEAAVRAAAIAGLGYSRALPAGVDVAALLRAALARGTPAEQLAALQTLELLELVEEARAEVLAALDDPALVDHAARLAGTLEDDPDEVVARLHAAYLRRPSHMLVWGLRPFGPRAAPAVPTLTSALATHPDHREPILSVLEQIGPDARQAVPALLDLLAPGARSFRVTTIRTLGAIGDPRALPTLRALATDRDEGVRRAAEAAIDAIE